MATAPFVTLLLSHVASRDDRIGGAKLFGVGQAKLEAFAETFLEAIANSETGS